MMNTITKGKHILAVTGHRPDKLYGYGEDAAKNLFRVALWYFKHNKEKIDYVITGMALGWDIAVARACAKLDIPFVAAVPCYGQEARWRKEDITRYKKLLKKASKVVYVHKGNYNPSVMQKRNVWMVDNSTKLLALWNGDTNGGTFNCIEYAKKKKLKIEYMPFNKFFGEAV